MAKRTIIQMTDDLDGSEAAETIRFGIDGTSFEIDLSGANAAKLRAALKPYVEAAPKSGRRPDPAWSGTNGYKPKRTSQERDNRKEKLAEIRRWAAENRIKVNDRGRVAESVVAAFRAGNPNLVPEHLRLPPPPPPVSAPAPRRGVTRRTKVAV